MQRTKIAELLRTEPVGTEVLVKGWVKAFRNNQFIALNDGSTSNNLQVVVDFENTDPALINRIKYGAAIGAQGLLIESQGKGQKVELKATPTNIVIYGDAYLQESYQSPIQPKKQSLEFLREKAHLRLRTNTFAAIFRIRHTLAFAIHKFFNDKGFYYLHTPIITGSDAEGAGEMFQVTTLDLKRIPFKSEKFKEFSEKYYDSLKKDIVERGLWKIVETIDKELKELNKSISVGILEFREIILLSQSQQDLFTDKINKFYNRIIKNEDENLKILPEEVEKVNFLIASISKNVKEIKKELQGFLSYRTEKSNKYYFQKWFVDLINPSRSGVIIDRIYDQNKYGYLSLSFFNFRFVDSQLRINTKREVDFDSDFFKRSTNLTVSGQLEGELGATALGDVYTFGPTFRAENSNTTRHLAEFWMIEPEVAFADLNDNMNLAEEMLQYVIRYALEHCADDLKILEERLLEEEKSKPQDQRSELSLLEKLRFVTENEFERLTYTKAIDILKNSTPNKKGKFQYPVEGWGTDLQSEHERYLVEKHFKKPVILTNYPAEIKAFYMRQDEPSEGVPGPTVSAMDILFPGIGEIVGGSQREERYDRLVQRMNEMHIPTEELSWYLDTRRFGTCPHAGFGLGFERLVLFVTGMTNIRDVIAFPRYPGSAEF